MGKLSSFFGGSRRAAWLGLVVGLTALMIIGEAGAKSRGRRGDNDNSWSGSSNTSAGSNRGDTKNDKNGKNNKDDDDDDDARPASQRDNGKSSNKPATAGKGADDNDPPRTVVEMVQRMFPGNAGDGGKGDGDKTSKADASGKPDTPGKPDAPGKPDTAGKKDAAGPAPGRALAASAGPQVVRATQRARAPALGWLRDTRATDLFRRDEVLIVNASRARMAELKFAHVETITTATSSVSRFVVPEGFDAISARQLLREQAPGVQSAFNYVYRPYLAANDPAAQANRGQPLRPGSAPGCTAERCYGPSLIHWAPDPGACTIEIGVGVIDTGFDSQHPAFKDRKINWSTVLEGENVSVQAWHGTGVLALLSGHPQSSTPGLIPNATFTATNTFYSDANGQPATDTSTLIKALKLMDSYKVKVVNLSLAGPQDAVLHKQIKDMSETGVLFVAAAGNGGPFALPSYPAAYPEVIAVTAVDRNLIGYRHATRGPHIDLAAPGVDIWTALPDKKEGPQTGTSFAVPYVTAAAAAVYPKEDLVYRGRPLDPKQAVLSRLTTRDLGPVGRDSIYGQGLLQAPAKCADKLATPVEVSSAWSPTLQPVMQPVDPGPAAGLMSLTPSAEVRWPGVVQHLSFQNDQ